MAFFTSWDYAGLSYGEPNRKGFESLGRFPYRLIAPEAPRLRCLGMSQSAIARVLGVDRKTVNKALLQAVFRSYEYRIRDSAGMPSPW